SRARAPPSQSSFSRPLTRRGRATCNPSRCNGSATRLPPALPTEATMRNIFAVFGRSPFGPLAQHTERVHETVQLLRPLFEAFLAQDWARTDQVYQQISKLEHKADVLKNEIRDHLPKSMFLPVDRGDILLYLKEQDGIADRAEHVAVLRNRRHTPAPAGMQDDILEFVDLIIATS